MTHPISSNIEDYLETIHLLEQENGSVRVKDVAKALNITMPSVSGAIKKMEKRGLVLHPRYDLIALTSKGSSIAESVYQRHRIIKIFLQEVLGLDQEIAEQDACRIEHNISQATLDGLQKFIELERGSLDAA